MEGAAMIDGGSLIFGGVVGTMAGVIIRPMLDSMFGVKVSKQEAPIKGMVDWSGNVTEIKTVMVELSREDAEKWSLYDDRYDSLGTACRNALKKK